MSQTKLNILVLHGGYQSGDLFYKRTGSLRKLIKAHVNFTYITAPHMAVDEEMTGRGMSPNPEDGPLYKWWNVKNEEWHTSPVYYGIEDTIEVVKKAFREQGPFDGILGFSQGGVLASILCALNTSQSTPVNPISFKFAIIAAAFPPSAHPHADLLKEKADDLCPTLHFIGEKDMVVNPSESENLAKLFPNPVVHRHSGGHCTPTSSAVRTVYADFFLQFKA